MATTRTEIAEWIQEGILKGATHMIVACDTFEYDDYPVYVMPGENAREVAAKYDNREKMSRVMEVYNLKGDIPAQLAQHRSFNY